MWRLLVLGLCVEGSWARQTKIWPKPETVEIYTDQECMITAGFAFTSELTTGPFVSLLADFAIDATGKMATLSRAWSARPPGFTQLVTPCVVKSCALRVELASGRIGKDTATESYGISFSEKECVVTCKTAFGCMHGVRSFLQLVDPIYDLAIPTLFWIWDQPQLSHRGLMLDTGAHFLSVGLILESIEMMAEVKLNVLHWHIADHQSFPMESLVYPKLSRDGAFSPKAVYSQTDVKTIVAYARARGIRVVPELDVPAHTTSWFKGYPELLGFTTWAIDPTREENYVFLENLLVETRDLFATDINDERAMIHLGGDETAECWDVPGIAAWMTTRGMTTKADLIKYWISRLSGIAAKIHVRLTLWADFLADTGNSIAGFADESNRIVWQTWEHSVQESMDLAAQIGRDVIHSAGFYLDHTWETWMDIYGVALWQAPGLVGAETSMWTAWADETNVFMETWPRAAAAAERFWCGDRCSLHTKYDAVLRLAKWRCRMVYLFGHPEVAPVGDAWAETIENFWVYASHADKTQLWCPEADLDESIVLRGVSGAGSGVFSYVLVIYIYISILN